MRLERHAIVQLGNGQAIIGGFGYESQDKIYLFNCMDRNCSIHQLSQELSVPRYWFVAIPIPDTLSGCITGGKKFHKNYQVNLQFKILLKPVFFQSVSWLILLGTAIAMIGPITDIATLTGVTVADHV